MQAKINNKECEIELISKDENKVEMMIDGKLYSLDVTLSENGFCSIIYDGHSFNAEVTKQDSGIYSVTTNFQHFDVDIIDPQKKYLQSRKKDETSSGSNNDILALMPGKVVRILVKVGDKLTQGTGAIVVEAMKMQNTFSVKQDCTVKSIEVSEGDSVNRNQVLITFE